MSTDIDSLARRWHAAKQLEAASVQERRECEDAILAAIGHAENTEGTATIDTPQFRVKIASRLTKKVDPDLVQEVAAEHGLAPYLSTLFRWRAEISATAWKAAPESVTDTLSKAITTTASRPTFAIDPINPKE